jgi:hypothetical protein|tara:strand:- start:1304 stop:1507 length:204 start_codon:yes stop_codon:yes gene_type:complete
MKKNSAFKLKSGNKPSPAKLFGTKQRKAKDFEAEQIAQMSGMKGSGLNISDPEWIKKNMLKGKKYDV